MAELALMESTLLPANAHMDTLVEIAVQVCKSNFIQNVLNDFLNIPRTDFFSIFSLTFQISMIVNTILAKTAEHVRMESELTLAPALKVLWESTVE